MFAVAPYATDPVLVLVSKIPAVGGPQCSPTLPQRLVGTSHVGLRAQQLVWPKDGDRERGESRGREEMKAKIET